MHKFLALPNENHKSYSSRQPENSAFFPSSSRKISGCAGCTHPFDVVTAGLEMVEFVEDNKNERIAKGQPYFELRCGIHTGPVVAGIVGIKKFAYDIWGDTVNTASRMEISGGVGKVNISGTTYEIIKDKFTCIPRGKIEAKNKGSIDMYFVEGGI